MNICAQKFVVCWISTISYLKFFFFNLLIFFNETYNTRLQERYRDNLSTHPELDPELWLKVRLSGRPYRNQIYNISNITAEDL